MLMGPAVLYAGSVARPVSRCGPAPAVFIAQKEQREQHLKKQNILYTQTEMKHMFL